MIRCLILMLITAPCIASDVPMRSGDQALHTDIHYDYDVRHNSYHSSGGFTCSVCNTTVEDGVRSREGVVYCLDCWDHFFWEEWEISD